MADHARTNGFQVVRPVGLNYFRGSGLYNYIVETDRSFPNDKQVTIFFDANTGESYRVMSTRSEHFGVTVSNWLFALHQVKDPVDYMPYRVLVAITGLVVVMLSITGVYIWWKKRCARRVARRNSRSTMAGVENSSTAHYSTEAQKPAVEAKPSLRPQT